MKMIPPLEKMRLQKKYQNRLIDGTLVDYSMPDGPDTANKLAIWSPDGNFSNIDGMALLDRAGRIVGACVRFRKHAALVLLPSPLRIQNPTVCPDVILSMVAAGDFAATISKDADRFETLGIFARWELARRAGLATGNMPEMLAPGFERRTATKSPIVPQLPAAISDAVTGAVASPVAPHVTTETASQEPDTWLRPEEADTVESDETGHGQPQDERPLISRQIRQRRGQALFREAICNQYGKQCLVTGCEIFDILEAAHIRPYRGGVADNHADNGLLLRADIHTLFDLDLLGIHPDSLRIDMHPSIVKEYAQYHGKKLGCGNTRPSRGGMLPRYQQFLARLKKDGFGRSGPGPVK